MPYFITSTILFILALVIIFWIHNQYHLDIIVTSAPPPTPANAPLISVCIPARNEEHNIRNCVEAVLAQNYPNIEVIVLDDRSTDGTLTRLKRSHLVIPVSSHSAAQTYPKAGLESLMHYTRPQQQHAASGCAL